MEGCLAPAKAVLRNLLTNDAKTVAPSSNLCLGAGLFVCIDVVWETEFCSFFQFLDFRKK